MTNSAAQHMARLSWAHGTTPKRQAAARINGKKGGRPKNNKGDSNKIRNDKYEVHTEVDRT